MRFIVQLLQMTAARPNCTPLISIVAVKMVMPMQEFD
jgi:hypothetical protein